MAHQTPDQNLASRVVTGLARWVAPTLWLVVSPVAVAQLRSNMFNELFVQVTSELPLCPIPEPPGVTEQEFRDLAHDRAQRGVSCWLAGRCRLENAYLYDAEQLVRRIDDVEGVINQLIAGTDGKPGYRVMPR